MNRDRGADSQARAGDDDLPTSEDLLLAVFRSTRANAVLSWLLVGVLLAVFLESVLDFDRQWVVFVAATGIVVLVPPVAARDWKVMLPAELLVLALLPILVRGLFGGRIGTFGYFLAVAALALVITVELHTYTSLEVTHWFAVALVVLTTMASVAAWTIVRWNFDQLLGTSYLTTNEALMQEFVRVTLAGFSAGLLFDAYFRRRNHVLGRLVRWVVRR